MRTRGRTQGIKNNKIKIIVAREQEKRKSGVERDWEFQIKSEEHSVVVHIHQYIYFYML